MLQNVIFSALTKNLNTACTPTEMKQKDLDETFYH